MGYTGCWQLGSPITVDNSANVGFFTSMKVSSVPSWNVPYSIDSGGVSRCSLAVDNSGLVQIAYYNSGLYYGIYTTGLWSIESVYTFAGGYAPLV